MLAVGSRLAPVDLAGLVVHPFAFAGYMLAVTLHRQLLEISRETFEILLIGQNCRGLRTEKIAVPDCQKPHQRWQILTKRRGSEMLIHLLKALQHGVEV